MNQYVTWLEHLRADPLEWLLSPDDPAVRAATLCQLLHRQRDDPEVAQARRAAMTAEPIRSILAAQDPHGWWSKPGPGYGPKPLLRRAIDSGVECLFSRDPAVADYPMGWGNTKPNSSWFKFGFPSGYVADVLQTAEVLAELGHAQDARLADALALIESVRTSMAGGRTATPTTARPGSTSSTKDAPRSG